MRVEDDADLAARAAAGDTAAFGSLVERHQAAVYRAAFAALGSREDAQEVAQEAFLAAFQKLADFRGEATLRTWLLAIAWRRALTRRKSLAALLRRFTTPEAERWAHVPSPDPDPERIALGAELRREIRRLVATLPLNLRDALLLSAAGEYRYEEIAAMLGVPIGTLKWRVSEARRLMKSKLQALGY